MACGSISVRIEKSADLGVIVAGLEVIEAGFGVVDVATVAQGVILVQGIGVGVGTGADAAGGVTPSVIFIGYDSIASCVQDGNDISLEVYGVEVCSAIEVYSQGRTQCVITDSQGVVYQLVPCVGYLRKLRTTAQRTSREEQSLDIGDRLRSPMRLWAKTVLCL